MGNVAKLQVGPEETSKEIEETSKEIEETSKEIKKTSKEIHSRIIDVLEMRPEIAVREIAKIMGMSVSGTRYHIDKLKKNGIFER